jgi:hypothetical protein
VKRTAVILHVVLFGYEPRPLALKVERGLKVSVSKVKRRKFGPKREAVTGWRKFHNEELRNSYSSSLIIRGIKYRRMEWVERVAHMGSVRNAYKT